MDEKTITTYNSKAGQYAQETDDFWVRFPSDFIQVFITELKGKKVLDIGSGPGRDAEIFRKAGLDITCVDASDAMVALTAKKGLPSILGNFLNLPFENESNDGVWAYTSLLHISKHEVPKALQEISRVLKKDGVFGLGMIEGEGEEERLSMGDGYPRHFAYFTREELKRLAQDAGFIEIFFEKHPVGKKPYLHLLFRKG